MFDPVKIMKRGIGTSGADIPLTRIYFEIFADSECDGFILNGRYTHLHRRRNGTLDFRVYSRSVCERHVFPWNDLQLPIVSPLHTRS